LQLHVRNLVILLRHDLLCGDYAAAADALTTLMPERRMIPDVVFKTCLQVCDSVLYIFFTPPHSVPVSRKA